MISGEVVDAVLVGKKCYVIVYEVTVYVGAHALCLDQL